MLKVNNIRLHKQGIETVLSPLEYDVLNALWKNNNSKVREIHRKLRDDDIALTSVAVILDRLHKKGLVDRKIEKGLGGAHYIYNFQASRADLEKSIIENTVDRLIKNFGDNAINYFNERFKNKKD